jgi:hypothetical protein
MMVQSVVHFPERATWLATSAREVRAFDTSSAPWSTSADILRRSSPMQVLRDHMLVTVSAANMVKAPSPPLMRP